MSWIRDHAAHAATQYSLLARHEMVQLGVGEAAIDHSVGRAQVDRVQRSVYALPGAVVSFRQRVLAAVLSAGIGAVASHRTAAILLGVAHRNAPEVIEITVPRLRNRKPVGTIVHRIDDLSDEHCVVVDGIPCTGPLRLMVDLGAVEPEHVVEDALDRALTAGIVTIRGVEWMLTELSVQGRAGCGVIRKILDERALGSKVAEGLIEPRMARIFKRFAIPMPEFQYELRTASGLFVARFDFAYPHVKHAFEVDGYEKHGTPSGIERDWDRDRAARKEGWTVDHFLWNHVVRRQKYVAEVILEVLGRSAAE
jgi:hypothetical protein